MRLITKHSTALHRGSLSVWVVGLNTARCKHPNDHQVALEPPASPETLGVAHSHPGFNSSEAGMSIHSEKTWVLEI